MDYTYSKEYMNPQTKDIHHYGDMAISKIHRNSGPMYPVYPPPQHAQMQMHQISPKNVQYPIPNKQLGPAPMVNGQQSYIRGHPGQGYGNIENCPPLMNNNHLHHPMGEVSNLETPKGSRGVYSNGQDNYPATSAPYNGNENIPYSEQVNDKRQGSKQNTSHNLSGQKSKIQNSASKNKQTQNGKAKQFGQQRNNESTRQLDSENSKNTPPEEQNFNYYHEFCRLYTANVVLTNQLKELVGQKTDLLQKLTKLEKKSEELGEQEGDDKKKRFRRIASQIDRHYKCPHPSCQKSYGSEGSLNQHLKIKHPELYQGGPTNSNMDSDRNSYYNGNNESFNDYDDEDDSQQEYSVSVSSVKNKKQKSN